MSRVACLVFLSILLVMSAAAQSGPSSQPTVWATKPDAAAFEKIVNDRLAEGQKSIDKIVAVKGPRTIENTLMPWSFTSSARISAKRSRAVLVTRYELV